MLSRITLVSIFMAVITSACTVVAAAPNDYKHPTWVVSKMAQAPTIDGVINADEYANASMITGMVTHFQGGNSLVAEMQDVSWWMGYDDKYLYIAMRSPQRPGTWPRAQCKVNDGEDVLWDDHVEIQIATRGRDNTTKEGYGFYKVIANARGVFTDDFYHNGTPGSERIWSTGGACRASVHKDHWDLELSIALDAMATKSLDGKSWTIQLVRADHSIGAYYAGWVGTGWTGWDEFGEVVFDPNAPAFRFAKRGKVREGELNLGFEIAPWQTPSPVDLLVRLTDPKGNTIKELVKTAWMKPGSKTSIDVNEKVSLPTDGKNSLYILATMPAVDSQSGAETRRVLYENKMPVSALTPEVYKEFIQPWIERTPQAGEYVWDFGYWPGYGIAKSSIDLDFFGMSDKIRNANAFVVSIYNTKNVKKAVATSRVAIPDTLMASMTFETGKLPVGDYLAKMTLIGADGKTVVATKEQKFLRRTYAWEGNKIGCEDMVLPPYTPLVADTATGTLKSVLRDYKLSADGLFAQVRAGGDGGPEDILASPIRLEAESAGQPVAATDAKSAIVDAKDARIKVASSVNLGGATVEMKNDMEIDGWYDVKMTVKPRESGAYLDRLSLVIPLWKGADTMYIHRFVDGIDAGKNRIPAGDGVVWNSGTLLPMSDNREKWGSFVPIAYCGNGDKGVWWFGEENRDWTMSDKLPAVQYVRTKDGVELRINIFAAHTKLDTEKKIHFALLVDPVKTADGERKWSWFKDDQHSYTAYITGWRRWGRSTDGYWLEDQDCDALNDFMSGKKLQNDRKRIYPGYPVGPRSDSYNSQRADQFQKSIESGKPIVFYGSNSNMSKDLPEFNTYAGEWGNSLPSGKEIPEADRAYNLAGSYAPKYEDEMGEFGCNWVQSQVDCFIWYSNKLLTKTPVNGTWWDNASNFLITEYDPVKKEFYQKWSVFTRREVTKRLNTLQAKAGNRPFWLSNMGAEWSWNQMCWHVENGFYVTGIKDSMLDQFSVDQFRSLFRLRRGIVHQIDERGYSSTGDYSNADLRKRWRVLTGLCLIHDIGWKGDGANLDAARLAGLLDDKVGFFSEKETCPFTGYWRSADMVAIGTSGVYCSVYRGKDRAALVVLNENKNAVDVPFTVNDTLLGRRLKRIYDIETSAELQSIYNQTKRKYELGEYLPGSFGIEGHGLRVFIVE